MNKPRKKVGSSLVRPLGLSEEAMSNNQAQPLNKQIREVVNILTVAVFNPSDGFYHRQLIKYSIFKLTKIYSDELEAHKKTKIKI